MNVSTIMATVPMTVSIQKVVIIVSALLDTIFKLTSVTVKVKMLVHKLMFCIQTNPQPLNGKCNIRMYFILPDKEAY